ncbi:MAG: pyrroline-5-carboxylate reductase [Candidatus Berkiella sp.]
MTHFGKIGIIGGGHMGSSLVGGLLQQQVKANDLLVADNNPSTLKLLNDKWGVSTFNSTHEIVSKVDILVLAVKPQQFKALLQDINKQFDATKTLVISIAAGITTTQIIKWLANPHCELVRAMPNTPALVGAGITGLYATPNVGASKKQQAQDLLGAVGETVWIKDESLMDVVTALSGSGPAYFYYLMETLINSATTLGLSHEVASKLTLQTAVGSAKMAQLSKEEIATLRAQVTSKGGTTEAGIAALKDGKLQDLITKTLQAATKRGKALSQEYD